MQEPSYILGVRSRGQIVLSGKWLDDTVSEWQKFIGEERKIEYIPVSRRLFGVEWWSVKYCYTAIVVSADATGLNFRSSSPVVVVRSEWWRRFGFRIAGFCLGLLNDHNS